MMSSWLESSGLDGLLVAARLLLERTTLPELHLLQAWCDRELATQKVLGSQQMTEPVVQV